MGQNDHIERFDASRHQVKCRCGARYAIYEDDGIPGCRDIETADCKFCGAELARHFGTCDGRLIDDHDVSEMLKVARREYDNAVQAYIQKYGYNWGTSEYAEIRKHWQDIVQKSMKALWWLEGKKGHKIPLPMKRGFKNEKLYGKICYSNSF